jgi:hypothetical protein
MTSENCMTRFLFTRLLIKSRADVDPTILLFGSEVDFVSLLEAAGRLASTGVGEKIVAVFSLGTLSSILIELSTKSAKDESVESKLVFITSLLLFDFD